MQICRANDGAQSDNSFLANAPQQICGSQWALRLNKASDYFPAGTAQNLSNIFLSSAAMSTASRCSMSLRWIM